MKANAGARAGDALVFTKRVGHGRDFDRPEARHGAPKSTWPHPSRQMLTLNRRACEAMLQFDVHGCTDVTGFGLIGHAREMALASGVTLEIEVDRGTLSSRRAGICAPGRDSRRAEEQSRIRLVRGGTGGRDLRRKSRTCSTIRRLPAAC